MKILIITDSRGYCPGEGENWVDKFKNRNSQHEIVKKNWVGGRISTIFEHIINIERDNSKYDLIIAQTGYHDYVQPWTKRIFKFKLKGYDPDYEDNMVFVEKNLYRYRNDKLVQEQLKKIKKYTKNLLLIGSHQVNLSPDAEKATLVMNKIYSEGIDYFNMPMNYCWTELNTLSDHIHYNKQGDEYICSYVERYIKRLDKTIFTILNRY